MSPETVSPIAVARTDLPTFAQIFCDGCFNGLWRGLSSKDLVAIMETAIPEITAELEQTEQMASTAYHAAVCAFLAKSWIGRLISKAPSPRQPRLICDATVRREIVRRGDRFLNRLICNRELRSSHVRNFVVEFRRAEHLFN